MRRSEIIHESRKIPALKVVVSAASSMAPRARRASGMTTQAMPPEVVQQQHQKSVTREYGFSGSAVRWGAALSNEGI